MNMENALHWRIYRDRLDSLWISYSVGSDPQERELLFDRYALGLLDIVETLHRNSFSNHEQISEIFHGQKPAIVDCCKRLLSFVKIEIDGGITSADIWIETALRNRIVWSDDSDISVHLSTIFPIETVPDSELPLLVATRSKFLNVVRVVSWLFMIESLRREIVSSYGALFAQLLLSIIKILLQRIEILSIQWSELLSVATGGNAANDYLGQKSPRTLILESSKFVSFDRTFEKSNFLVGVLMAMVDLVTRLPASVTQTMIQAYNLSGYAGDQPWTKGIIKSLNVCDYPSGDDVLHQYPTDDVISSNSRYSSMKPIKFLFSQACHQLYQHELQDSHESQVPPDASSCSLILTSLHDLFLSRNVIGLLVMVLRKLTLFGNVVKNEFVDASTTFNSHVRKGQYIWRSCVSIQCNVLHGLLGYLVVRPTVMLEAFYRIGGEIELQSIVSMADAWTQLKVDRGSSSRERQTSVASNDSSLGDSNARPQNMAGAFEVLQAQLNPSTLEATGNDLLLIRTVNCIRIFEFASGFCRYLVNDCHFHSLNASARSGILHIRSLTEAMAKNILGSLKNVVYWLYIVDANYNSSALHQRDNKSMDTRLRNIAEVELPKSIYAAGDKSYEDLRLVSPTVLSVQPFHCDFQSHSSVEASFGMPDRNHSSLSWEASRPVSKILCQEGIIHSQFVLTEAALAFSSKRVNELIESREVGGVQGTPESSHRETLFDTQLESIITRDRYLLLSLQKSLVQSDSVLECRSSSSLNSAAMSVTMDLERDKCQAILRKIGTKYFSKSLELFFATLASSLFNDFDDSPSEIVNAPPETISSKDGCIKACLTSIFEGLIGLPEAPALPRFQIYTLWFLSYCLQLRPVLTSEVLWTLNMSSVLVKSPCFIRSGQGRFNRLSKFSRCDLVETDRITPSTSTDRESEDTSEKWIDVTIAPSRSRDDDDDRNDSRGANGLSTFLDPPTDITPAKLFPGLNLSNAVLYPSSVEDITISHSGDSVDFELHSPRENASTDRSLSPLPLKVQQETNRNGDSRSRAPSTGSINSTRSRSSINHRFSMSHVLVRDLTLELFWLAAEVLHTYSSLNSAKMSISEKISIDISELVNLIEHDGTGELIIQISRWIHTFLRYGFSCTLKTSGWSYVLSKSLNLARIQVSSAGGISSKLDGESVSLTKEYMLRPLHWIARVSVLQLIYGICTLSSSSSWLKSFLPSQSPSGKGHDPQRGASAVAHMKSQKHAILLRLCLDLDGSDVALFILTKVFSFCAQIIVPEQSGPSSRHAYYERAGTGRDVTLFEALLHDIIRGLFSVIKSSPSQPAWIDGHGAAVKSLAYFTAYLRDLAFTTSGQFLFDHIFNSYGVFTHAHQLFHWTGSRQNIWRECIGSASAALNHVDSVAWSNVMKSTLMQSMLKFVCAMMSRSEVNQSRFYRMLLERNRSSVWTSLNHQAGTFDQTQESNLAVDEMNELLEIKETVVRHVYDDLVHMVVNIENSPSLQTVHILLEMMLDKGVKLNTNLKKYNFDAPAISLLSDENNMPALLLIENIGVIPVLVNLAIYCDYWLQESVFATFLFLVSDVPHAHVNISRIKQLQLPMLDMLLDTYPRLPSVVAQSLVLQLIQCVGKFSISMSQLKRMFRFMQDDSKLQLRSQEQSQLRAAAFVECLAGMVDLGAHRNAPEYFFQFSGQESGLELPTMDSWKATKGYSVSFWFSLSAEAASLANFDNISGVDNGSVATDRVSPHQNLSKAIVGIQTVRNSSTRQYALLNLTQASGTGIELKLVQKCGILDEVQFVLRFSVYTDSKENCVETDVTPKLQAKSVRSISSERNSYGDWHHLAISHSSQGFRVPSEVQIILDGTPCKLQISYPRFNPQQPVKGFVGNFEKNSNRGQTQSNPLPFAGDMSAIYFFSDALSESALNQIHRLGANYAQLFETEEKCLSNSLWLTVSPHLSFGNFIVDNAPDSNSITWGSPPLATMLRPGTLCNSVRYLADELDCLGGIKTLFPLLRDLSSSALGIDQSRVEQSPTNIAASFRTSTVAGVETLTTLVDDSREVSFASDAVSILAPVLVTEAEVCLKILDLILSLIRNSIDSQKLLDSSGFALVAYFLEKIAPSCLTVELLDCILRHVARLSWNAEWQESAIKQLVFNMKIWMHAKFDVHLKLLCYAMEFNRTHYERASRILSVQTMVDILGKVYAYPALQSSKYDVLPVPMRSEKEVPTQQNSVGAVGDLCSPNLEMTNDYVIPSRPSRSKQDDILDKSDILPGYETDPTSYFLSDEFESPRVEKVSTANTKPESLMLTVLTVSEISELRALVYQMIFSQVMDSLRAEYCVGGIACQNIIAVVRHVVNETHEECKFDALKLMLSIISSRELLENSIVIAELTKYPVLPLLASLAARSASEANRLFAMVLTCSLVRLIIYIPFAIPHNGQEVVKSIVLGSKQNDVVDSGKSAPKSRGSIFGGNRPFPILNAARASIQSYRSKNKDIGGGVSEPTGAQDAGPQVDRPGLTQNSLSPNYDDHKSSTFFGINEDTVSELLIWVHNAIIDKIEVLPDDAHFEDRSTFITETDAVNCNSATIQLRIMFEAIQLTMYGKDCSTLVEDIEKLFPLNAEHTHEPEMHSLQQVPFASAVESYFAHQRERDKVLSWGMMIIPSLFSVATSLLEKPFLSSSTRLFLVHSLFSKFVSPDCKAGILQLQGWQRFVLKVLLVEQDRLNSHIALFGQPSGIRGRTFVKTRGFVGENMISELGTGVRDALEFEAVSELVLDFICDMQKFALTNGMSVTSTDTAGGRSSLYIGALSSSRSSSSRNDVSPCLPPRDILEGFKAGTTFPGSVVVRETLAYLRSFAQSGVLDIPRYCTLVLTQAMNAIKLDSEAMHTPAALGSNESAESKQAKRKLIAINTLQIAAIITEYVTTPVIQPARSIAAIKSSSAHHGRNDPSFQDSPINGSGPVAGFFGSSSMRSSVVPKSFVGSAQDSRSNSKDNLPNSDKTDPIVDTFSLSPSPRKARSRSTTPNPETKSISPAISITSGPSQPSRSRSPGGIDASDLGIAIPDIALDPNNTSTISDTASVEVHRINRQHISISNPRLAGEIPSNSSQSISFPRHLTRFLNRISQDPRNSEWFVDPENSNETLLEALFSILQDIDRFEDLLTNSAAEKSYRPLVKFRANRTGVSDWLALFDRRGIPVAHPSSCPSSIVSRSSLNSRLQSSDSDASATAADMTLLGATVGTYLPINSVNGVISALIRVLTDVFLESGNSSGSSNSLSSDHRPRTSRFGATSSGVESRRAEIKPMTTAQCNAFRRLKHLQVNCRECFANESVGIVGKSFLALRNAGRCFCFAWSIATLELCLELLSANRALFVRHLIVGVSDLQHILASNPKATNVTSQVIVSDPIDEDFFVAIPRRKANAQMPTPESTSPGSIERPKVEIDEGQLLKLLKLELSSLLYLPNSLPDINQVLSVAASGAYMTLDATQQSELLLKLICIGICPDKTEAALYGLTWKVWDHAMGAVLKRDRESESQALAERLTEMGFDRHTEEVMTLNEQRNRQTAQLVNSLDQAIKATIRSECAQDSRRLIAIEASNRSSNRNTELKWKAMWRELSNERGPWGSTADSMNNFIWAIDMNESHQRTHPFLIRYPFRRNYKLIGDISAKSSPQKRSDLVHDSSEKQKLSRLAIDAEQSQSITSLDKSGMSELLREVLKYKTEAAVTARVDSPTQDIDSFESRNEMETAAISIEDDSSERVLVSSPCRIVTLSGGLKSLAGNSGHVTITRSAITFNSGKLSTTSNDVHSPYFSRIDSQDPFATDSGTDNAGLIEGIEPTVVAGGNSPRNPGLVTLEWRTDELYNILPRFVNLRKVGVELFFTNRKSLFLDLFEIQNALAFQSAVRKILKPSMILDFNNFKGIAPSTILQNSRAESGQQLSEAWANREISNFDYLIQLNMIAGRSYNDLGQYPIFPWIIADYSSHQLDLSNPKSFRDLKRPIGAQTAAQIDACRARYHDMKSMFDEEERQAANENDGECAVGSKARHYTPPFHFGSHYSVAGFVIWYLMRLEPFTSLHIELQDGKFDKPDRLFTSIGEAYSSCTSSSADVKELIPEFFNLPEMFMNINKLDMGVKQSGESVGDVELPPWAATPYDFVRINREALESEYVSSNLHHWIDLVFGYKQRPPYLKGGHQDSVEACNVFYHLTYEGAVDLETLKKTDPELFDQYTYQIAEFGQTPAQLLTRPHIQRKRLDTTNPKESAVVVYPIASCVPGFNTVMEGLSKPAPPGRIVSRPGTPISNAPILFIAALPGDKLWTVDTTRRVGRHDLEIFAPNVKPLYSFRPDRSSISERPSKSGGKWTWRLSEQSDVRRLGVPFSKSTFVPDSSRISPQNWRPKSSKRYRDAELKRVLDMTDEAPLTRTRTNSFGSVGIEHSDSAKFHSGPNVAPSSHSRAGPPMSQVTTNRSSGNDEVIHKHRVSFTSNEARRSFSGRPSTVDTGAVVDDHLSAQLFVVVPEYQYLINGGGWDHAIKVTSTESCRQIQSVVSHKDTVTCLAISRCMGKVWLVSGAKDCTIMVWLVRGQPRGIGSSNSVDPIESRPLHILYGHDAAVTSVSVIADFDLIISGSDDGTIIVHSLIKGTYVRSLILKSSLLPLSRSAATTRNYHTPNSKTHIPQSRTQRSHSLPFDSSDVHGIPATPPVTGSKGWSTSSTPLQDVPRSGSMTSNTSSSNLGISTDDGLRSASAALGRCKVTWTGLSPLGYIVVYCADHYLLFTFSFNGELLAKLTVDEKLYALIISEDGKVLLTGGDHCLVVLRWVHSLCLADDGPRAGFQCVLDGEIDQSRDVFSAPIRSLFLTKEERLLIVGLETGELRILSMDSDYLHFRLTDYLRDVEIL